MAEKLYPDFPVPIAQQQDPETQPYLPAPMFDFETGDFVRTAQIASSCATDTKRIASGA